MATPNSKPSAGAGKPRKPRDKVVQKANQSRNRNKGSGSGKMFGAVGGYGGVSKKSAKQLVNSTVRPTIQAMLRDKAKVNTQAGDAIQDANSLYSRSVGDLNHIFGAADQKVSSLGQQINSGYDQTMGQVAAQDAASGQQVASNNSAVQQAIMSELSRLGLSSNMGVSESLMGDAALSQNVSTQTASNNQANLQGSQQAANTVSGLLGGMIAGSKASNMGQVLNTRNADVADVGRAQRDDLSEIMGSIQEMRKSKPGMIRDMLMQLQAQGFDQWQAIQALNMDRRSLNHSIGMDRAGMAEDGSYYGTLASAFGTQALSGAPVGSGLTASGTPQPTVPSSIKGGKPKKIKRTPTGSNQDEYKGPLAGGYY